MNTYTSDFVTVYCVEALEGANLLEPQSIHCAVTSPPFYNLRSYLDKDHPDKGRELGTESSPDEYVEKLVAVFEALKPALRDDGLLFVNLGQSYQNKQLVPVAWLFGIAMQRVGWWLRSDVIWAKGNPLPSSVTDRPSTSHEYILMFSKRPRYYFDAEAVREDNSPTSKTGWTYRNEWKYNKLEHGGPKSQMAVGKPIPRNGRNIRTVWYINSPKAKLRDDLSDEKRSYVVGELLRRRLL